MKRVKGGQQLVRTILFEAEKVERWRKHAIDLSDAGKPGAAYCILSGVELNALTAFRAARELQARCAFQRNGGAA
ncbi:hypothetical protein [Rhodanobacter glycinis]|uniref:hypothetical protein n=1 Tax=Rhodanobacter glycinis TaxID=582702 RepID=UPI0011294B1E|nr:hypothetical protein [Rhodanobacter glycinis]